MQADILHYDLKLLEYKWKIRITLFIFDTSCHRKRTGKDVWEGASPASCDSPAPAVRPFIGMFMQTHNTWLSVCMCMRQECKRVYVCVCVCYLWQHQSCIFSKREMRRVETERRKHLRTEKNNNAELRMEYIATPTSYSIQ